MKKKISPFLAGFLSAALLMAIPAAYAANAWTKTIEVGSINIMVNGKEFHPTDPNGNPVDVFVYNGTTYAPLRALAEAYGLTVGYDTERNMATVTYSNPSAISSSAQSSTTTVKFYSAHPTVPDFGSLFNVPCSKTFSSHGTEMYLYNVASLPSNCMMDYADFIHEQGFLFLGDFPDASGNTVIAFSNRIYNVSIGTMWVDSTGYVAIMINRS